MSALASPGSLKSAGVAPGSLESRLVRWSRAWSAGVAPGSLESQN